MPYLDTLLPFLICAALGFWAVLSFMPSNAHPAATPLEEEDTTARDIPWAGGKAPHRFGHDPHEP